MNISYVREIKTVYSGTRKKKIKIMNIKDVYKFFKHLSFEMQEQFCCLMLDGGNYTIGYCMVGKGDSHEVMVSPRDVFRNAVACGASGVVLVHNHPSGSVEISESDRDCTDRFISAGEILGIKVVDHVIIGDNCYLSVIESEQVEFV